MVSPFANAILNRIAGNAANRSVVCGGLPCDIVQACLCLTNMLRSDRLPGMSLGNNTLQNHDLHGTDLHGDHLQGNNLRRKVLGLLGIQVAYRPTSMRQTAAGTALNCTALNCTALHWIGLTEFQGIRVSVGGSDRHRRSGIIGWYPYTSGQFLS